MNKNNSSQELIRLENISKAYRTEAGDFPVLKGIDLTINSGEFVGVVGKSGSGKSTLINMITGIDRPTNGEIYVAGTPIHDLNEGQIAVWRGKSLGIVFQFFQLLPTLTVAENVMLPMDFANIYSISHRQKRASDLLKLVEIGEQADKLPSQLSGGQQQRAAIARALACDPPIIVADEPTGNLDSKTADKIFDLFEELVKQGKTIVMVTHDSDLARKLGRTLVISDGQIIEEYLERTFPTFTEEQLIQATADIEIKRFDPGKKIVSKGQNIDHLYVVTRGEVEIVLSPPDSYEFVVDRMTRGKYFGEVEMLTGKKSVATARASHDGPVELAAIDYDKFRRLMNMSHRTKLMVEKVAKMRLEENIAKSK